MPNCDNAQRRFDAFVAYTDDGCWIWQGPTRWGYGMLTAEGASLLAHRFAYEMFVGPIPSGLQLDHLCRTPACVRPDHLEPVTNRVNSLRGRSPQILAHLENRCLRGHPFTPENTLINSRAGGRLCRTCRLAYKRTHYAASREQAAAAS